MGTKNPLPQGFGFQPPQFSGGSKGGMKIGGLKDPFLHATILMLISYNPPSFILMSPLKFRGAGIKDLGCKGSGLRIEGLGLESTVIRRGIQPQGVQISPFADARLRPLETPGDPWRPPGAPGTAWKPPHVHG